MENTTVAENKVTQSSETRAETRARAREREYASAMVAKRIDMIIVMMMKMNHWIIAWNHRYKDATM